VTATRLVPRSGQYANHAKKEGDWGFPSRMCKTNPILPPGRGLREQNVQNEPNARSGAPRRCLRLRIGDCRASLAMTCCGSGTSLSRGQLYKQTQLAGANRATSPRCPASGNKANSRRAGRGLGTGVPSCPSGLAVNCAKQSQFRQREKKRQGLGRKGVMVNSTSDRPRQNKANLGEV
jgi:hypothetical protein